MAMMRKLSVLTLAFAVLLPGAYSAGCVKSQRVLVETGLSPNGAPWTVKAKRSSNGGRCDQWLFQVQFKLPHVVAHTAATLIPVGGQTSRDFTISALDAEGIDGLERAFSGYTGREAARILLVFEDGSRTEIVTKSPPERLRQVYVWMRGFRYFVYYYPAGIGVSSIKLLTKSGEVLHRIPAEGGGYFL